MMRSTRRSKMIHFARASGGILVLLAALLLGGCGTTGAAEHGVSSEPEGPVVASGSIGGEAWRLSVDRRDDGSICSWLELGPSPGHSAYSFGCSAGRVGEKGSGSKMEMLTASIETGPRVPGGQIFAFITDPSVTSLRVAIVLPNRIVERRMATVKPVEEGVAQSAGFDEAFGIATVLLRHSPDRPCFRRMFAVGINGEVLERSPPRSCARNYFAPNSAHGRPAG